jgi:predicted TPR repeat methyltransferase
MEGAKADTNSARSTYDAFASVYDEFNYRYQYERWTGRLLGKAEEAGLSGKRLLDVACGTGLSFLPMLDRGFSVTACDISEAMLEIARSKVGDRAELTIADMRELPRFGEFDLVWSVNDSLNYLLSGAELEATLAGFRRNLTPAGIALFDVNTLTMYRTFFSEEVVSDQGGRRLVWRGQSVSAEVAPGGFHEASFEVGGEPDLAHIHRQRHFPEAEVLAAMEAADLKCVGLYGELEGELTPGLEEDLHTKAVYVCRAR